MNYREKIRKAIECPQFGNEGYGEWGALRFEQRVLIKRLLDELDSADNYFKKVYLENEKLKKELNELKKPQIFIDTQDMEEQYGEELYQDYLEEQVKELKKQLEEKIKIGVADHKYSSQCEDKVITMETQQQEFINYLEDETKEVEKTIEMLSDTNSCRISNLKYKGNTLKEILQKYKEIIGRFR